MKQNKNVLLATILIALVTTGVARAERRPESFQKAITLCQIKFLRANVGGHDLLQAMSDFADVSHLSPEGRIGAQAELLIRQASDSLVEACALGKFNPKPEQQ